MLAGSGSAGFYRGTSRDQTPFFQDKEKKLVDSKKWPEIFEKKIDLKKVNMEIMRNWVTEKLTEILGLEDDILIQYTLEQLNAQSDGDETTDGICPKKLSVSLTAFLGKKATVFVSELWTLLLSASSSPHGVPKEFIEKTKIEMQKKREEAEMINKELMKRHELALKVEFERQMRVSSLSSSSSAQSASISTSMNSQLQHETVKKLAYENDKNSVSNLEKRNKSYDDDDRSAHDYSRKINGDDKTKSMHTKYCEDDEYFRNKHKLDAKKAKKHRHHEDDSYRNQRERDRLQISSSRKRGRSRSMGRDSDDICRRSPSESRRKVFTEKKRKKKKSHSRSCSGSLERGRVRKRSSSRERRR